MRALLDASQDEILLLGIEGDVLAINKAAEHRLARRANGAHLIGARLDRLLSHDQAELRLTRVREVAATRNALHCEVPVRSRWFDFWYYPVVLPDKPVTEVAVYAREVTEQKKLLGDLSKLFQALQQSPMSVIITDREGTIEYVNPEFAKVTGYTTEEAIGQNPRILKSGRMPPELYEELWQTITAGGVWRGELLNKKKNGELPSGSIRGRASSRAVRLVPIVFGQEAGPSEADPVRSTKAAGGGRATVSVVGGAPHRRGRHEYQRVEPRSAGAEAADYRVWGGRCRRECGQQYDSRRAAGGSISLSPIPTLRRSQCPRPSGSSRWA